MAIVLQEPQQEETTLTQIRNQLKSQDLATLSASTLETVGGRVFPDNAAVPDLRALVEVLDAYRAVHVPTYGQPIPGTSDAASHTADAPNDWKVLIQPSGETVTEVQVINIFNNGTGPVEVDIGLIDSDGAAYVAAVFTVNPSERVNGMQLTNGTLTLDRNTSLQFRVVTGTFGDVSIRTYAIDVVN